MKREREKKGLRSRSRPLASTSPLFSISTHGCRRHNAHHHHALYLSLSPITHTHTRPSSFTQHRLRPGPGAPGPARLPARTAVLSFFLLPSFTGDTRSRTGGGGGPARERRQPHVSSNHPLPACARPMRPSLSLCPLQLSAAREGRQGPAPCRPRVMLGGPQGSHTPHLWASEKRKAAWGAGPAALKGGTHTKNTPSLPLTL
jgi:hypothetical protein